MKNAQILNDVIFHVVNKENKVACLNCNGNHIEVCLRQSDKQLMVVNSMGKIIDTGIYGLVRFLNNTVVDEVKLID